MANFFLCEKVCILKFFSNLRMKNNTITLFLGVFSRKKLQKLSIILVFDGKKNAYSKTVSIFLEKCRMKTSFYLVFLKNTIYLFIKL